MNWPQMMISAKYGIVLILWLGTGHHHFAEKSFHNYVEHKKGTGRNSNDLFHVIYDLVICRKVWDWKSNNIKQSLGQQRVWWNCILSSGTCINSNVHLESAKRRNGASSSDLIMTISVRWFGQLFFPRSGISTLHTPRWEMKCWSVSSNEWGN